MNLHLFDIPSKWFQIKSLDRMYCYLITHFSRCHCQIDLIPCEASHSPAKWTIPANSWVMFSLTLRCLLLSTKKLGFAMWISPRKGMGTLTELKIPEYGTLRRSTRLPGLKRCAQSVFAIFVWVCWGWFTHNDKQQFITPCFTIFWVILRAV